ncbi:SecDF P1 head subdomain-containing protein [Desulfuribacillus alkaliarsenatis]|uniref:SecDF P1 head subdomain domain-containing protein n=1 Tax=Desulfuribacillus alkaliarsenatis TaxID=766136 RepID=A0A1E5G395_9FIRM|nr:hypothetical protein [Desulfuribacillus alkaliarsenatis]OEF97440.1 hypothetical protein BHF68_04315 [Desulfuribacillus alkaliarsenatis]
MKINKQSKFIIIVSALLVLLLIGCSNQEENVNIEDARIHFLDADGFVLATEYDLASGENQQNSMDSDQQELVFSFKRASKLADMTEQNLGKEIRLYLDGELIAAPRVIAKITDGKVVLTGIPNEVATEIIEAIYR